MVAQSALRWTCNCKIAGLNLGLEGLSGSCTLSFLLGQTVAYKKIFLFLNRFSFASSLDLTLSIELFNQSKFSLVILH